MPALAFAKVKAAIKRAKEKVSVLAAKAKAVGKLAGVTTKVAGPKAKAPILLRRAVSAAGAAFLALGAVGLAVFGYLIFTSGGFTALTGMASGIGLLVSLVVLLTGIYMK
jgi:hypothetical protein